MDITVLDVLLYTGLTATATALGAIPFIWAKSMAREWVGLAGALAVGLMLAASFQLFDEGLTIGVPRVAVGVVVGMVFIMLSQKFVDDREEFTVGELEGADALKALLIVGVMTLHSFAEGVGLGVSFGRGMDFGISIVIAIAVHNVAEGLAISLVLVSRGVAIWKAALWSMFSSLPQPLLAVPAFLFVETFQFYLPVGLGLAAGAMIWMATAELLPDAFEDSSATRVATVLTLSLGAMLILQMVVSGH